MNAYGFMPCGKVRIILALHAPIYWSYWTQPRVRLFRRQLRAVNYSIRLSVYIPRIWFDNEEESDNAR